MYKNNKKSKKKNKRKPQKNSNPHDSIPQRTASETLTTPSENISKPAEPQKNKFIPGTIIELTGLISKPEYNGRSGVIRKQLDNGRYRIMTNDENDLAVQKSNLKIPGQCPFRFRLKKTGILVWPHIRGVSVPSVQWMDDDCLNRSFINPYDKNGPFKHYWALPDWKYEEGKSITGYVRDEWVMGCCCCDPNGLSELSMNRSVIMRDYETRLKKLLNWKNPMMWYMFDYLVPAYDKKKDKVTWTKQGAFIYWDGDSKAPINEFFERLLLINDDSVIVPEVRGPVFYVKVRIMSSNYEKEKKDLWSVPRFEN